jgi:hypothetical protein
MQQSITDLSEEVNSVPSNPVDQANSRQLLSGQNTVFVRPEVRHNTHLLVFLFVDFLEFSFLLFSQYGNNATPILIVYFFVVLSSFLCPYQNI